MWNGDFFSKNFEKTSIYCGKCKNCCTSTGLNISLEENCNSNLKILLTDYKQNYTKKKQIFFFELPTIQTCFLDLIYSCSVYFQLSNLDKIFQTFIDLP